MESQSWLSCFCSSQNWLLLLPFVIKKGWARIRTKVHILFLFVVTGHLGCSIFLAVLLLRYSCNYSALPLERLA